MNARTPSITLRVESRTRLWRCNQVGYVFLYRYQDNVNADWWWRLTDPETDPTAGWEWRHGPDPVLDHLLFRLVVLSWEATVGLAAYGKSPGPAVVDALRRPARDRGPHGVSLADRFANYVIGTTTIPPSDSRAYSSTY